MWYSDFADRLESWHELRTAANGLPLASALELVNTWWHKTPWTAHYLHWDDEPTWPDPWELLSDNIYCELARGLGILYTVSMLTHEDLTSAALVLTHEGHNLVKINKELYILNWDDAVQVNTPHKHSVKRSKTIEQVQQQYKL